MKTEPYTAELRNGWFAVLTPASVTFYDPGCPSTSNPFKADCLTFPMDFAPTIPQAEMIAEALEQAFQAGQLDGMNSLRNQFRTLLSL